MVFWYVAVCGDGSLVMTKIHRLGILALALALLSPAALGKKKSKKFGFLDDRIETSVEKAVEYIFSVQNMVPDDPSYGSWEVPLPRRKGADGKEYPPYPKGNVDYAVGRAALCVYGLLECGIPPTDKRLVAALDWLIRQNDLGRLKKTEKPPKPGKFHGLYPNRTYSLALRACALGAAIRLRPNKDYTRVLKMDLSYLLKGHYRGGYGYYSSTYLVKETITPIQEGARIQRERTSKKIAPSRGKSSKVDRPKGTVGGRADHSNSQYGVLGLWAAQRANFDVPSSYWQTVEKFWAKNQTPDGGWGYTDGAESSGYASYPPMTCAGLASLYVALDNTSKARFAKCNQSVEHKHIARGLAWLEKYLRHTMGLGLLPQDDPLRNEDRLSKFHTSLYFLYSLERVGVASGYKYLGGVDWFRAGTKHLLTNQSKNGSWSGKWAKAGSAGTTALGLLFLAGGRKPVLFNKLRYDGDWNNRPRNLAKLTRWFNDKFERQVRWQIVDFNMPLDDWRDAPILVICGSVAPKFSDDQIDRLRRFVHQGGMIFSITECQESGKAFADGMRKVYARLFPGYPLLPVGENDPPVKLQYELGDKVPLHMVSNQIRPLAIHTDRDVSLSWQFQKQASCKQDFEAAVNISMMATDKGFLRNHGVDLWPVEPKPLTVSVAGESTEVAVVEPRWDLTRKKKTSSRSRRAASTQRTGYRKFRFLRVQHEGNWNPEPLAMERFVRMMKHLHGVTIRQDEPLDAADLSGAEAKIALMTGTGPLTLNEKQTEGLKQFLQKGGTLLVDAAGGDEEFYNSARKLFSTLLEEQSPKTIPTDSPIFTRAGMVIEKVAYRRMTGMRTQGDAPRIETFQIGDRMAVFLSREDLTVGLLGASGWEVDGYAPGTVSKPGSAFQLVRNLLVHAATARQAEKKPDSKPKEPTSDKRNRLPDPEPLPPLPKAEEIGDGAQRRSSARGPNESAQTPHAGNPFPPRLWTHRVCILRSKTVTPYISTAYPFSNATKRNQTQRNATKCDENSSPGTLGRLWRRFLVQCKTENRHAGLAGRLIHVAIRQFRQLPENRIGVIATVVGDHDLRDQVVLLHLITNPLAL